MSATNIAVHRLHMAEAAVHVLQPLPSELIFPCEGKSVKEICIRYCQEDVKLMESFLKIWPAESFVGCELYLVLAYLTPLLDDHSTHGIFTQACANIRLCTRNMHIYHLLLQGIQAIIWGLGKEIPTAARRYFSDLRYTRDLNDIPLSIVLPRHHDIRNSLLEDEFGNSNEAGISGLIAKYSALSMKHWT